MTDTGFYRHGGEVWHVVQRNDGSVSCKSPKCITSASAKTWEHWKKEHGWERIE